MKNHSILTILVILISSLFTSKAQAYDFKAENEDGVTIYYDKKGSDAAVTSGDKKYDGDVKIPAAVEYDGKRYNVTSIGEYAFYSCGALRSIEIPSTITSIEQYAFSGCSQLSSLAIPGSITSIGTHAFSSCRNIVSLELSEGLLSIGNSAFDNCDKIQSITIPTTVKKIGTQAFGNNDGLVSISVAKSNSVYDSRNDCNAIIETVTNTLIAGCQFTVIPEGLKIIGEYAFYFCGSLRSIEIPSTITSIEQYAFSGCSQLSSLAIPGSITSIGTHAFSSCRNIASLELSEGLLSIGNSAFDNCDKIQSISIPTTVKKIGTQAFGNNDGLVSISVAKGNSIYDSRNDCNAIIETVTNTLIAGCQFTAIPEGVKIIGEYAFYFCRTLRSIEFPSTITSIEQYAFSNCSSLIQIKSLVQNPFQVESSIFTSINKNAILYVPQGTKEAYESVGGWNFSEIIEMVPEETSEKVTFADSRLRTFCSSNALDISGIDGLKAYIASGFNVATGDVIMTQVDKVPANTGVLLEGEAGSIYEIPFVQTEVLYSNLLTGVLVDSEISQGYALGDDGYFTAVTGKQAIKGGEAYLNLPVSAPLRVRMILEDSTTTRLSSIKGQLSSKHPTWYSLQGARLMSRPTKQGMYLHGGHKVIIK